MWLWGSRGGAGLRTGSKQRQGYGAELGASWPIYVQMNAAQWKLARAARDSKNSINRAPSVQDSIGIINNQTS